MPERQIGDIVCYKKESLLITYIITIYNYYTMKTLTESRLYLSSELEKNIHLADSVNILIFDEENILEQVTF